MKKTFQLGLLFLGALALSFTLATAEGKCGNSQDGMTNKSSKCDGSKKCDNGKCDSSKKRMKCHDGKCDGSKKCDNGKCGADKEKKTETKPAPTKGKCGQGKCG